MPRSVATSETLENGTRAWIGRLGRNKFRARCRTEDDVALGNRLDVLPLHEVGNVLHSERLCRRLPDIVTRLGVAFLNYS